MKINNIDSIYDQLEEFCKKFDDDSEKSSRDEPTFEDLLADTSDGLQTVRKEIIDAVVTKANLPETLRPL